MPTYDIRFQFFSTYSNSHQILVYAIYFVLFLQLIPTYEFISERKNLVLDFKSEIFHRARKELFENLKRIFSFQILMNLVLYALNEFNVLKIDQFKLISLYSLLGALLVVSNVKLRLFFAHKKYLNANTNTEPIQASDFLSQYRLNFSQAHMYYALELLILFFSLHLLPKDSFQIGIASLLFSQFASSLLVVRSENSTKTGLFYKLTSNDSGLSLLNFMSFFSYICIAIGTVLDPDGKHVPTPDGGNLQVRMILWFCSILLIGYTISPLVFYFTKLFLFKTDSTKTETTEQAQCILIPNLNFKFQISNFLMGVLCVVGIFVTSYFIFIKSPVGALWWRFSSVLSLGTLIQLFSSDHLFFSARLKKQEVKSQIQLRLFLRFILIAFGLVASNMVFTFDNELAQYSIIEYSVLVLSLFSSSFLIVLPLSMVNSSFLPDLKQPSKHLAYLLGLAAYLFILFMKWNLKFEGNQLMSVFAFLLALAFTQLIYSKSSIIENLKISTLKYLEFQLSIFISNLLFISGFGILNPLYLWIFLFALVLCNLAFSLLRFEEDKQANSNSQSSLVLLVMTSIIGFFASALFQEFANSHSAVGTPIWGVIFLVLAVFLLLFMQYRVSKLDFLS